jgi:CubicO group peptidase (beta-lactamase class C family)
MLISIGVFILSLSVSSQPLDVTKKLKGFDQTVEKILKDWNVPGCGIGIVYKGKLVFAKGYGYRDIENKLPVTPNTLFHIASNTKLFTATAIGFLVEEGKLEWDRPIKDFVPRIEFYNDELNRSVTIRDMLSHRTGISRHDGIWYRSEFNRQELFDRIKYLEPSIPLRQGYLYNNLMYVAAGQIVEDLSGQTWEEFVTSRIFSPLQMTNSLFVVDEMIAQPDFVKPYYEKRDTNILLRSPYYPQQHGLGSAGAIISNINDMSNWVIAQLHRGNFKGEQVIPAAVVKETMQPAIPTSSVPDKYFENLNVIYGMGRSASSYKGHYLVQHTGSIGGNYSIVSMMPADSIGIIVFTNRLSQIPTILAYTIYDRLLGLEATPWSERGLKSYLEGKETSRMARSKPDTDRVPGTEPSHRLSDYAGIFEDAAYGVVEIGYRDDSLRFRFNHVSLPLYHYHYDRFMTPDDEVLGRWSILFSTDAQGDISQAKISMDEKEVVFIRKPDTRLTDQTFLKSLEGVYAASGSSYSIVLRNRELVILAAPPMHLDAWKDNTFRIREFSDQTVEFIFNAEGRPTGVKVTADGNSVEYRKQ